MKKDEALRLTEETIQRNQQRIEQTKNKLMNALKTVSAKDSDIFFTYIRQALKEYDEYYSRISIAKEQANALNAID